MSSLQNLYNELTGKNAITLLDNVSADVNPSATVKSINGGAGLFIVRGDAFGGGSVNLEMASAVDPAKRFSVISGPYTVDTDIRIDFIPAHCELRCTFIGSAGASNVSAILNLDSSQV